MGDKPNQPINTNDPNNPNPNPQPPALPAIAAKYGPMLNLPAGLDGVHLMIALAINESSLGRDVGPRHEPAYDVGGSVYQNSEQQRSLVDKYGSAAACSYGPWQMMFINFAQSITPDQLSDFDLCAREFVRFFNSYVIRTRKADTLSEVGQVWNGGHVFQAELPAGIANYVKKLQENYDSAPSYLS